MSFCSSLKPWKDQHWSYLQVFQKYLSQTSLPSSLISFSKQQVSPSFLPNHHLNCGPPDVTPLGSCCKHLHNFDWSLHKPAPGVRCSFGLASFFSKFLRSPTPPTSALFWQVWNFTGLHWSTKSGSLRSSLECPCHCLPTAGCSLSSRTYCHPMQSR